MKREEIVKEALEWRGTKWQHQACLKGVACDCVGLVRGVYRNVSGERICVKADYPATWHIFKSEERLYNEAKKYMKDIPAGEMLSGDVMLFGFGKGPAHHLGIYIGNGQFIHSWADVGKVELSTLAGFWEKNFRGVLRFKGVK